MFGQDNKKTAALILAAKTPPAAAEDTKDSDETGTDDDTGLESAAQDVLDAFKSDSASDLAKALKSFCELADDDSEYEEKDDGEKEQEDEQE